MWDGVGQGWSVLKRGDIAAMVVVLNVVFMVLALCIGMLLVRDRWLIRTIRLRVRQASCPGCGYSLLGLAVELGVVTCPECAAPFFLADHGMTPEDIIAPRKA
jgi:ribosomal protein S27AE